MQKVLFPLIGLILWSIGLQAQEEVPPTEDKQAQDSIFIQEVEASREPLKILHAEPLYVDLIRDLGARKGEREWNLGLGMHDNLTYDSYEALVEYEWAPIDRLGLEIEVPFTLYAPNLRDQNSRRRMPSNRIESLKTAAQYTFLVSDKWKTSMALGYMNELLFTDLNEIRLNNTFSGNLFNPFFVAARRWGNNFHSLIYTGPRITKLFQQEGLSTGYEMNTSFHYMITGTRNFVGIEFNKEFAHEGFDMVIRPQMRLEINEHLMVGIVTGIPIRRENERLSTFLRLIYEPRAH
jgi:hypothetical protein